MAKDTLDVEDIRARLISATIASCTCNTKSHHVEAHDETCMYRLLSDAEAKLTEQEAEIADLKETIDYAVGNGDLELF